MTDITYITGDFFTRFYANTKEGESICAEIIRVTGDGAVLNIHVPDTIKQIKAAGYTVSAAKKASKKEIDKILDEFSELFD